MAAFVGDFDEGPEENDPQGTPLPIEDRLWRHPSELGNANPTFKLDPVAVRRRWLQTETTRGSAWTAGIVGALLATGLVVLGTHLVTAMTGRTDNSATNVPATSVTIPALATDLSPRLEEAVALVGAATARVEVSRGSLTRRGLGLVVRSDGMLLVPASEVNGASAIVVTPANNVEYVGEVIGVDGPSGLAIVHINGAAGLRAASLAGAVEPGEIALAVTAPGGAAHNLGTVRAVDTFARVDDSLLIDAMTLDLGHVGQALGAAVIDGNGEVVGVLTSARPGAAVAAPAWLARVVADQLMANGFVKRGWLGVTLAGTLSAGGAPPGADVVSVVPGSAGARAGLRPADVIESVNGERVTSVPFLLGHLYALRPGATVALDVLRNHSMIRLRTRLADVH